MATPRPSKPRMRSRPAAIGILLLLVAPHLPVLAAPGAWPAEEPGAGLVVAPAAEAGVPDEPLVSEGGPAPAIHRPLGVPRELPPVEHPPLVPLDLPSPSLLPTAPVEPVTLRWRAPAHAASLAVPGALPQGVDLPAGLQDLLEDPPGPSDIPANVEPPGTSWPLLFVLRCTVGGVTRAFTGALGADLVVDADGNASTGLFGADLRVRVTPDPTLDLVLLPAPPRPDGTLERFLVEFEGLDPARSNLGSRLRELEATVHVPLGGGPAGERAFPPGVNLPGGTEVDPPGVSATVRGFAYAGYRLPEVPGGRLPLAFRALLTVPPVPFEAVADSTLDVAATSLTADVEVDGALPAQLALLAGLYQGERSQDPYVDVPEVGLEPLKAFRPADLLAADLDLAPFPRNASVLVGGDASPGGAVSLAWKFGNETSLDGFLVHRAGSLERRASLAATSPPKTGSAALASGPSGVGIAYEGGSAAADLEAVLEEVQGGAGWRLVARFEGLPESLEASLDVGDQPSLEFTSSDLVAEASLVAATAPYRPPEGDHVALVRSPLLAAGSLNASGAASVRLGWDGTLVFEAEHVENLSPMGFRFAHDGAGLAAEGELSEMAGTVRLEVDPARSLDFVSDGPRSALDFAVVPDDGATIDLHATAVPEVLALAWDPAAGVDLDVDEAVGSVELALEDASGLGGGTLRAARVTLLDAPDAAVRWLPDATALDARALDLDATVGLAAVAVADGPFVRTLPGNHVLHIDDGSTLAASLAASAVHAVSASLSSALELTLEVRAQDPQLFTGRIEGESTTTTLLAGLLPSTAALTTDFRRALDFAGSDGLEVLSVGADDPASAAKDRLSLVGVPDRVRVDLDVAGGRLDFLATEPIQAASFFAQAGGGIDGTAFRVAAFDATSLPSFGAAWDSDLTSLALTTENPSDRAQAVQLAVAESVPVSATESNYLLLDRNPGSTGLAARLTELREARLVGNSSALRLDVSADNTRSLAARVSDDDQTTSLALDALQSPLTVVAEAPATLSYQAATSTGQFEYVRTENTGLQLRLAAEDVPERLVTRFDAGGVLSVDPSEPLSRFVLVAQNQWGLDDTSYTEAEAVLQDVPPVDVAWGPGQVLEVVARNGTLGRVQLGLAEDGLTGYGATYAEDYLVMTATSIAATGEQDEVSLRAWGVQRLAASAVEGHLRLDVKSTADRAFDLYALEGVDEAEGPALSLAGYQSELSLRSLPDAAMVEANLSGVLHFEGTEGITKLEVGTEQWGIDEIAGAVRVASYAAELREAPTSAHLLFNPQAAVASANVSSTIDFASLEVWDGDAEEEDFENMSLRVSDLTGSLAAAWSAGRDVVVLNVDNKSAVGKVTVGMSTGAVQRLGGSSAPEAQVVMYDNVGDESFALADPTVSLYVRIEELENLTASRAGDMLALNISVGRAQEFEVRFDDPEFRVSASLTDTFHRAVLSSDLASFLRAQVWCVPNASCKGSGSTTYWPIADLEVKGCLREYRLLTEECHGDHVTLKVEDIPQDLDLVFDHMGYISVESSADSADARNREASTVYANLTNEDSRGLFGTTDLAEFTFRIGGDGDIVPSEVEVDWRARRGSVLLSADPYSIDPFPILIRHIVSDRSELQQPNDAENWFLLSETPGTDGTLNYYGFHMRFTQVESIEFAGTADPWTYRVQNMNDHERLSADVPGVFSLYLGQTSELIDLQVDLNGDPSVPGFGGYAVPYVRYFHDADNNAEVRLDVDVGRFGDSVRLAAKNVDYGFRFFWQTGPFGAAGCNGPGSAVIPNFTLGFTAYDRLVMDHFDLAWTDGLGVAREVDVDNWVVPKPDSITDWSFQLTVCPLMTGDRYVWMRADLADGNMSFVLSVIDDNILSQQGAVCEFNGYVFYDTPTSGDESVWSEGKYHWNVWDYDGDLKELKSEMEHTITNVAGCALTKGE